MQSSPGATQSAGESRYAAHSNEALTALAAQWDTLDRHERRALLTEVRQRMAQRGAPGTGVVQIRTERRYGRIVSPDGRVIRIQTQVVRVRPATEAEALAARTGGFGVGFERRTGSALPTQPANGAAAPGSAQRPPIDQASALLPPGQSVAPSTPATANPR